MFSLMMGAQTRSRSVSDDLGEVFLHIVDIWLVPHTVERFCNKLIQKKEKNQSTWKEKRMIIDVCFLCMLLSLPTFFEMGSWYFHSSKSSH